MPNAARSSAATRRGCSISKSRQLRLSPGRKMMKFISDEQLKELQPAETSSFPSPVPTQIVSSDEYMPVPQSERQREVEARLKELSGRLARRQAMSRRRFFQTASGMAASFLVMNQVFGRLFEVTEAEAATPDMAAERAD